LQFIVDDKVFDILPEVCFGVVVARDLNNSEDNQEIWNSLEQAIEAARIKFKTIKPKEHSDLRPFREAFQKMGINPNKFPCSVEALTTRIAKGGNLPDINPVVNLVNAYSLKYTLPMGAHDLDTTEDDIEVRFSRSIDIFIPFGQTEPEALEDGELVYASGNKIRTRKWIWRQSDQGKVTAESKNIFFPIDGFSDSNRETVIRARDELCADLERIMNAGTSKFFLDKNNRSATII